MSTIKTGSKLVLNHLIAKAKNLAIEYHKGQFRKDGITPYVKHLEAVANSVEDRLKPIAWLHDLLEDTEYHPNDLKNEGFPPYVISAVKLLTHREGQPNMEYWKNILTNSDAVMVKIADIKHNLSDNPSENAKNKYKRALELFSNSGFEI